VSWYGTHPQRTKKEVLAVLPKGLCKQCIYWYRTMPGLYSLRYRPIYGCTRCGISRLDWSRRSKRLLEKNEETPD